MNRPNQIETKRLILRPLNQNDFEVFSDIIKDDEVLNNLEFVLKIKPIKNIKSLFLTVIDSLNSKNSILVLIVINKEDGNSIGSCGLKVLKDYNGAECFYTLLPKYRGFGFTIEAMKKLLEYAFKELKLVRIITFIPPTNSRSWKVAERIGMKYLGHKQIRNVSSKAMYFSIEKAEFEAQWDY